LAALRMSLATSPVGAAIVIVIGLAASWTLTLLLGGAQHVVPHFYYLPILFAAVRFGPLAALLVAAASGLLAGPLTPLDVASGIDQETGRWLTRAGFFVTIGVGMAALVRPSLPSIGDEVHRLREERRIRVGLEQGQFFLRFQPIIELPTGQLHGLEALVRWRHPDRGELAPGEFLAAAEASEVIHELGGFVLEAACLHAARWQRHAAERSRPAPYVSVNMSARELESPQLIRRVRDTLATSQVDPSGVCIELTESVLIDDVDISAAQLAGLKTLGVQLAVDDFGTGYSSLSAVHRFPVDILKIDRSFVTALDRDRDTKSLLGGLQLFARSLALTTVIEGIETAEQRDTLIELGFSHAQGFLFARPLAVDDIDELLTHPQQATQPRSQHPTSK